MRDMYRRIYSELKSGNGVTMMSLYSSSGSTPRKEGAKMAYFADSTTLGTVGGGAIEHNCITLAKDMGVDSDAFTKSYILRHDEKCDIGMVCGGDAQIYFQYFDATERNIALFERVCDVIEHNTRAWLVSDMKEDTVGLYTDNGYEFISVDADLSQCYRSKAVLSDNRYYIEPLTQSGVVYVFGGGHVSQALVPFLTSTDFRVVVYEDNIKFADRALFPTADNVVNASFLEINENVEIVKDDYAIILTRGHKSDNDVLTQVLSRHPQYLGVIGSSKKVRSMHEYLLNVGFDKAEIERIHSPIGMQIGAQTPSEIAVSITAQLINHRANMQNA